MEERMMILKMIEDGKVTAEEGLRLLEAIGKDEADSAKQDSHQSGRNKDTREESPLSKLSGFFETAIQKVKEGDLDFNFGTLTEIDHVFQQQNISPRSLKVSLENGSVDVVPWDKQDVRLECQVKVYRVRDTEQAKDFFLKESVFSATDETLLFETKTKSMKVVATLYVPQSSYGRIKLYTFNGALKGEDLKADTFEANTTNGSIKTTNIESKKASMETVNGSISCEQSQLQLLDAKTLNGSVKVSGSIQDADVETVNGSITYEMEASTDAGYVDLKTTTGSVKLLVSPAVRIEAKLKSNVGSINNRLADVEILDEKKEFAQRYMQLTGNQAQEKRVKVHAVANTGSITVQDKDS
ncbi:DUF4097 domain-containing protein [Shouchella clausii]|uniref:DUF4097 domain-containing protein n=1 Tax=Shouchella clausii TaxID=79880 RepID=UPI00280AA2EF|nr:DUF4097 domain-containing protein [Shouchella clausii]WMM30927.1 DUF4097 domain-containing protein [Shouchella clausii]